ncbi:MAG: FtsQ-type POTRA domain-containing protein [Nitrospiraceae bacterium]|nr:MAG: FtsQ-type POTRA domain-containing protein [Nitrospiraceae bacterium]
MRSKNNKKKQGSKRQGKLVMYMRRIAVFTVVAVFASATVAGAYYFAKAFYVRDIRVYGNNRLDKFDIEGMLRIKGEPLLNLRLKDLEASLRRNAWIRQASLRWILPGTVEIRVIETTPKALLNYHGVMFLVNEEGRIMEELEDNATPFLPVIRDIDPRYQKAMAEAMQLVETLASKKILADKQSVEIGLESYGLTTVIDGEFIKVGYGQYSEKFDRWIQLEPELQKRGVPIQYVDLRFKDSIIVKPVKPEDEKNRSRDKNNIKGKTKAKEIDKEKKIS